MDVGKNGGREGIKVCDAVCESARSPSEDYDSESLQQARHDEGQQSQSEALMSLEPMPSMPAAVLAIQTSALQDFLARLGPSFVKYQSALADELLFVGVLTEAAISTDPWYRKWLTENLVELGMNRDDRRLLVSSLEKCAALA